MKLFDMAHSRAGDKGNTLMLSLIPYHEPDYAMLCKTVTAEKVKDHLKEIVHGEIIRCELPNISSLLFVGPMLCQEVLPLHWIWMHMANRSVMRCCKWKYDFIDACRRQRLMRDDGYIKGIFGCTCRSG
jgi:hypothetical protein